MAALPRQIQLDRHVARLLRCRRCPRMKSWPVSGGAILSDVMLVGQAPGPREPVLKRPFAHTAGKTLFRWFEQFCGINEAAVRSTAYFAAVCRCFPGKNSSGGDRVPVTGRNWQLLFLDEWRNRDFTATSGHSHRETGYRAVYRLPEASRRDRQNVPPRTHEPHVRPDSAAPSLRGLALAQNLAGKRAARKSPA